jgi:hypothetical protein
MKHLWSIIAVVIYFFHISYAAEQVVNFSGTWRLDPKASRMDFAGPTDGRIHLNVSDGRTSIQDPANMTPQVLPETPPIGRITILALRIIHTDSEIQIERQFTLDGKERSILQKFTPDGSQCINLSADGTGEFVSRSAWKQKKLIHSGIQTIAMQHQSTEAHVTEEYSLSKDKNKLTIKTTSFMSQGVIKLKQEFIRQKDPKL